jgi:DNA-binding MarR family transcriptional regulator
MRFQDIDSDTLPESSSFLVKAIHRMSTLLARQTTEKFSSITDFDIVEWRVVSGLFAYRTATQKALVEYSGGDQAQTSRILARLEIKGMVQSTTSGEDKRARIFELTEAGNNAVEAAMPDVASYFKRVDDTLTRAEKATFIALLSRLLAAADANADER